MKTTPLVHNISTRLMQRISQAQSGQRLPTELALAKEMEVSRTTIRAAFQVLHGKGIIDGSGNRRLVTDKANLRKERLDFVEDKLPREREIEEYLLKKIASGQFKPGDPISELSIAREVGCSTTPVREALQSLRQLHIFEKSPRRQWRVVELDVELIDELIEVRQLVEVFGLRKLLQHGLEPKAREKLTATYELTQKIRFQKPFSRKSCLKVDMQLHRELLEATNNSILIENNQFIYGLIELQLHNQKFSVERMELGLSEHQQILEAILSENLESATQLLLNHLQTAAETFDILVR